MLTKNSSNSELATTSSKLNDYIWLDEKLKAMVNKKQLFSKSLHLKLKVFNLGNWQNGLQ